MYCGFLFNDRNTWSHLGKFLFKQRWLFDRLLLQLLLPKTNNNSKNYGLFSVCCVFFVVHFASNIMSLTFCGDRRSQHNKTITYKFSWASIKVRASQWILYCKVLLASLKAWGKESTNCSIVMVQSEFIMTDKVSIMWTTAILTCHHFSAGHLTTVLYLLHWIFGQCRVLLCFLSAT